MAASYPRRQESFRGVLVLPTLCADPQGDSRQYVLPNGHVETVHFLHPPPNGPEPDR